MRQKVSTLLPEPLYRRVRLEAVRQGKQISEVMAEALESHLGVARSGDSGGVAEATWGLLAFDRRQVARLLSSEPGLLDG